MAGTPILVAEIATAGSTLYVATQSYYTRSSDTPASQYFAPHILETIDFDRSVSSIFWGGRPRGMLNWGALRINNADGAYDSYVGQSLRDKAVTIKRGEDGDAYSTFSTVATLIVDRAEFTNELVMAIYVTDIGAKLERALQQSLYPTTTPDAALRGKPRPITIGKAYQVPAIRPDPFGNGHFDVHDSDKWVGIDQLMQEGGALVEGTAYQRSDRTGVYGFERLNAIEGKQAANVAGAWKLTSTEFSEDFADLTAWTETNGGVANRDVSIVSNAARILNTAGGADLSIHKASNITGGDSILFFYEFDCTAWTSGYAHFRTSAATAATEALIDGVGRYTGIVRSAVNWAPRFTAPDGSNCDLTIDNLRVRKVTLIEGLLDVIKFLTTNDSDCQGHGPLTTSDLDTTTISALEAAAPYELAFHAAEPVQIADVLDQVMESFGGWWYINRTGKLTVGRLSLPIGTPTLSLDEDSIAAGMRVEFDRAQGLSNTILAKRNWLAYSEDELVGSLAQVKLNSSDKDADVTLSNSDYTYSAANVGSVRSTPGFFGERYYVEVTITAVDGTSQHYVGVGNSSASVATYPGGDVNALAYRANGQSVNNASGSAFGNTYAANDVIGIAIDGRSGAYGCAQRAFKVYFSKNGTFQGSGNPDAETGFLTFVIGTTGVAYVLTGGNVAGTNSGTVNFGQTAFTYTPPADYIAPAHHRSLIQQEYRYRYESTGSLHASYTHADGTGEQGGIPTLLSRAADAVTECDRWVALYGSERFFYEFDALVSQASADTLMPGDLIAVTYPRFGLSAKLLRVVSVRGKMLERKVRIRVWG